MAVALLLVVEAVVPGGLEVDAEEDEEEAPNEEENLEALRPTMDPPPFLVLLPKLSLSSTLENSVVGEVSDPARPVDLGSVGMGQDDGSIRMRWTAGKNDSNFTQSVGLC